MNKQGCSFLESCISFEHDTINDCTIKHHEIKGMPVLIENYHGEEINWNEIFDKKSARIEAQKNQTIPECEGCYRISDYIFSGKRNISDFHFSQCHSCNLGCIYCHENFTRGGIGYETFENIKKLKDEGFYEPGGIAEFQGGEPLLMPDFELLANFFTENGTRINIKTNCVIFSNTLAKALSENKGSIVTSLDCGTKETYNKLKQADKFDIVCKNIKKYVEANPDNVTVKYLIVPGWNDNINDMSAFFKLIKKSGIKNTAIDLESRYSFKYEKDVSEHIFLLYDYFEENVKKYKMNMTVFSFLSYALKHRKIGKSKLIFNKWLYNRFVEKKKDINKNIEYKFYIY